MKMASRSAIHFCRSKVSMAPVRAVGRVVPAVVPSRLVDAVVRRGRPGKRGRHLWQVLRRRVLWWRWHRQRRLLHVTGPAPVGRSLGER